LNTGTTSKPRLNENLISTFIESSLDAVLITEAIVDTQGKCVDFVVSEANSRAHLLFNRTTENLKGISLVDILRKFDLKDLISVYDIVYSQQKPQEGEYFVDNEYFSKQWFYQQVCPWGQGLVIYLRNITERKQREKQFDGTKEALLQASKIARFGSWEIDVESKQIFWSDSVFDLIEAEQNYQPTLEDSYNIFPDTHKKRIIKAINKAFTEGKGFDLELILKTKKGNEIWVRAIGQVQVLNKKIIKIYGGYFDIDKFKRASLEHIKTKAILEETNQLAKIGGWEIYTKDKKIYLTKVALEIVKLENCTSIEDFKNRFKAGQHRDLFNHLLKLSLEKGIPFEVELELNTHSEETIWVRVISKTEQSQGKCVRVYGTIQDITQKKIEEQQLRLLESVITSSIDAVVITDATEGEHKIQYVNKAFTKMTGYKAEEAIGKSPKMLQGEETNYQEISLLREALKKWKTHTTEVINYKKNGEKFWNNFTVTPVADFTGKYTHWIAIQRDVTDRKTKELEREQLIQELTQNNKELKQFSYITSHNMRSPITNLMGIFELLDVSSIKDENTLALFEAMKKTTFNLKETLDDLINILIIKENINLELQEVEFSGIYHKVIESVDSILQKSNAEIVFDFTKAEKVVFNSSYLESIFLNMITNSIKYAAPNRKPLIKIYTEKQEGKVKLIFEDNGIGMNLEKIKGRIFGLYQKFHNHPDSKGIGLYLVHSQVTALGGNIEVQSQENVGTKFIITFKKQP
jgi:PAS domain S-box-containing protein